MSSAAVSGANRRIRLGNVEPGAVALLKQIDPALVMVALYFCECIYHARLTPALGAYATLAFILTGQLFTRLGLREAEQPSSDFTRTYGRVLLQWATVIAILLFVAFAFKASGDLARKVALTWFAVTPMALCASLGLRRRLHGFTAGGTRAPPYIIIGVNDVGVELARRLPASGFLGYFDFRSVERLSSAVEPARLAGHTEDVAEFVRVRGVRAVYIALPLCNAPRLNRLVNALRDTTASVYFVPDAFAFDLSQGRLVEINGMPALAVCDAPFNGMDALLKRAVDLTLASVALILTSPLMLAIAAAIKLTSKGPVLLRQNRYGLNGETIRVYRFRSMATAGGGAVVPQSTRPHARVTPVGRIIRRTSLDELPQLFNVLQGAMSVVGPRPDDAVAHDELYRRLIGGYTSRHKVRPGITGLAQISGTRGEGASADRMSERVRCDLEYLRHWSLWLDLKIVFLALVELVGGSRNTC